MGHNVFSVGGAYQNPSSPQDVKRPGFTGYYNDHLQAVAIQSSKEHIHQELIDWADVIYIMHRTDWVLSNWDRIKHKKVIYRRIGQSTSATEADLAIPRMQGLKLVSYSPHEKLILGFSGEDRMIRFYKDPEEFGPYTGEKSEVITVAQSMKKRGNFCGFNIFEEATRGMPRKLYGPDNEDSGIEGGLLSYDDLRDAYRTARVYFYTGTYPAPYTLNFMEAMMSGVPIVAINKDLADIHIYPINQYEVDQFIVHGESGFIGNSVSQLREFVNVLLNSPEEAKYMGHNARKKAIELFGKEKIRKEWEEFFESLSNS